MCGSGTCHVSDTLGSEKNFNSNIFFSSLSPFSPFFQYSKVSMVTAPVVELIEVPDDELLYS